MTSHNIEDFIEHSSSVPRDVVRICKTVREVEELSIKKMQELDENRKTFLMNKKGKGFFSGSKNFFLRSKKVGSGVKSDHPGTILLSFSI